MGGLNSGYRGPRKICVEQTLALSISWLLRRGWLDGSPAVRGLYWTNGRGQTIARISFQILGDQTGKHVYIEGYNQMICLESTPLHFGGVRWWFLCPGCSRRCASLNVTKYCNSFYCRVCHNLTYRSCQRSNGGDSHIGYFAAEISRKRGGRINKAEMVAQIKEMIKENNKKRRAPWVRKRDRRPDYKSRRQCPS